ncbi:MAG TPA: YdiU family protein [Vitreimonas sp.]|nr:YdiU family protein [Vitreimonas sp.]
MPVSVRYKPSTAFANLGPEFSDPVTPARFPQHILRRRNQIWAARVGLDTLSAEEWERSFAAFAPLPRNMPSPRAMRYHGHQFRNYNPDIGDGRGFLYAQLHDDAGRLLDLATKGSGQTPYSRTADGRLTLKGGVREVLAAEMLEAQGVYTSKAFSLFETGEALVRGDEPSPTRSSVLTRLSHSHIRFGSFQRHAFFERPDLMRTLLEHVAEHYAPEARDADELAAGVLLHAVREAARLAASWMAAGFVHGVLNTDNLTITGESFDYGPWRFVPMSDPSFTAAYFDETGLYAFARQPEAVSWALAQLGSALTLVCPVPPLEAALAEFLPAYQNGLRTQVLRRLGLAETELEPDLEFLQTMFNWLTESQVSWDQFFHDWFCADAARAAASPEAARYTDAGFAPVRDGIEKRGPVRAERLRHPYFQRAAPASLVIEEVETLWAAIAERDDWSLFEAKLAAIADMRDALSISCHQSVVAGA